MRVRVTFRYNAGTGEVEAFVVEDAGGRAPAAGHDARHDRAAADVARVVEQHARIEEVPGGGVPAAPAETAAPPQAPDEAAGETDAAADRRLRD